MNSSRKEGTRGRSQMDDKRCPPENLWVLICRYTFDSTVEHFDMRKMLQ